MKEGVLYHDGRMFVGKTGGLRAKVFKELHSSGVGGHSGVKATQKRVEMYFFWPSMKKDVQQWVQECIVCQQNKTENIAYPGLLQPLAIPSQAWNAISMDFVEGLPSSYNHNTVLVVVDRLTKYGHFIPLKHPYTAYQVAQIFFDTVFRLHGPPESIVSDRDRTFISHFWQELFKLIGTSLHMSSAYHPQSDGQTERLNRCLEGYLRCMSGDRPKAWSKWLTLAEWWYNTNFHTAIQITPFQAVYGYPPPQLNLHNIPVSKVDAVKEFLQDRRRMIHLLKNNLLQAQNRMKLQADKRRTDREFETGDWVFLKLQPYRQTTITERKKLKFAPKYYGPYEVLERIGKVAYRLKLPSTAKVHDVFHVSRLKKKVGENTGVQQGLPLTGEEGQLLIQPLAILDRRLVKKNNKPMSQVLVQWCDSLPEDATWEDWLEIEANFPEIQP